MAAVVVKSSIEALAEAVRGLEGQVREAEEKTENAELYDRRLAPWDDKRAAARLAVFDAIRERDELRAELEVARARWQEQARPQLVAERDLALKEARSAAQERAGAVEALFDAIGGLLEANRRWSGVELALRAANDRLGRTCAALDEEPPAAPTLGQHPLIQGTGLRLEFFFGSVWGILPAEAFEQAQMQLAHARKEHQ